jgi:hypothetical protein
MVTVAELERWLDMIGDAHDADVSCVRLAHERSTQVTVRPRMAAVSFKISDVTIEGARDLADILDQDIRRACERSADDALARMFERQSPASMLATILKVFGDDVAACNNIARALYEHILREGTRQLREGHA